MCSLSNVLRLRSVSTSTEWQARWPTIRMGRVWAWHSPGCKMSQSPSTPLSAAQHTEQVGEQWFSITVDKYEFKLLQFCLYLFTLLINFLQPIINVKLFFFLAMSLGLLKREFHSLQDRCRATILGHLTHEEQIDELKLPQRIKLFIHEGLNNFQDDDVTHNISQSNWSRWGYIKTKTVSVHSKNNNNTASPSPLLLLYLHNVF